MSRKLIEKTPQGQRMWDLMKALKLNTESLGKELGCGRGPIEGVIYLGRNFGSELYALVCNRYPYINRSWLKNGKGEMFKEGRPNLADKNREKLVKQINKMNDLQINILAGIVKLG